MVAGRKPKPTHLKLVTGNPGRRPLNQNEAKIRPSPLPGPPAYLTLEARQHWRELVPELHVSGILTRVDLSTMAVYCQTWGRIVQAEQAYARLAAKDKKFNGALIKTKNGNIIQNPLLGTINKLQRDLVKYAAELGITPSARSRVEAKPPPANADPAEEFGL